MKNYVIQIVYFRTGMQGTEVEMYHKVNVVLLHKALAETIDQLRLDLIAKGFDLLGIENVIIIRK